MERELKRAPLLRAIETYAEDECYDRHGDYVGPERALYEDYSGRSMYGATCLGFSTDSAGAPLAILLGYAAETGETEELAEMARQARTDSLGRGLITYFPGYTVEAAEETEEEEAA